MQGNVMSALNGHPVQGAVIVIRDGSGSEAGRDTTGADGTYVLPLNGPGLFTRVISYVNQFGDELRSTLAYMVQAVSSGGTSQPTVLNTIAGAVIDRVTGRPLRQSGIPLTINRLSKTSADGGRPMPATITTDARGTFVFDSLAPGAYTIRVVHPQFAGSLTVQDTTPNTFTVEANINASESSVLELVKTTNKRIAEVGDVIVYSINLHNASCHRRSSGRVCLLVGQQQARSEDPSRPVWQEEAGLEPAGHVAPRKGHSSELHGHHRRRGA
jgi:hypothetical protein